MTSPTGPRDVPEDLPEELRGVDDDLSDRYGSPRPPWVRGVALVAAGLVALSGLGWLMWAVVAVGDPVVHSSLVGFRVTSAHDATANVQVFRDSAEVTAVCLVRATAADHAIVGEQQFSVGPGGSVRKALAVAVRTERLATSVQLLGCTAPGQPRPR